MGDNISKIISFANQSKDEYSKPLTFGDSKNTSFKVFIKQNINSDDIHEAIDIIVENVKEQNFAYEVIDMMTAYYILSLFTDIEPPMISEDVPDYDLCTSIVIALKLKDILYSTPHTCYYLEMLEKNIWRKLEYEKQILSLIPFNDLITALGEFYNILEELDNVVKSQENTNMDELMSEINRFNDSLNVLTSNHPPEEVSKILNIKNIHDAVSNVTDINKRD